MPWRSLCRLQNQWKLDVDYSSFPAFDCTIGYGSGVFWQEGYDQKTRPMVDLLFVVPAEELVQWHQSNLKAHPAHYSGLTRLLGSGQVSCLQRWGPGVLYLPEVQLKSTEGGVPG
ncbi:unnamed protein product [Effrenium voratum]|nr:unnamed protein product [Effrenium voratum]